MNNEIYIKMRKLTSKIILITIYSSFIGHVLGNIQAITSWNYSIHELLFLPMNIAYFILPLELFFWLCFAIKSYDKKKSFANINFKIIFINLISILSLILILNYFIIQSHMVTTAGIFQINDKLIENNKYYILIDNIKVKCTWNEYNLIEEGNSYMVNFKYHSPTENRGNLEYIGIIKK